MKRALVSAIFGLLVYANQSFSASSFPFPTTPPVDTCAGDRQTAYALGFNAGVSAAEPQCQQREQTAYGNGVADGTASGIQRCQDDPTSCDITLGTVLGEGGYGETEANDNMVAADALVGGVKFVGQSYGPQDQDWYYLVTSKPNQILTVYFSVPWRDPATDNVSDWIVEVRDAAGNLYTTFATEFIAGNPNGDDEIAYPVTLGLVGTYYVVVKPSPDTLSAFPYHLAVVLQDSDLLDPPLVVNFFDAEVEPNNLHTQANPIATGVTMYGLINLRFDTVIDVGDGSAVYAQGEPDWFVYQTPGNEIVTLSFCDKQVCEAGDWFVQVFDPQGAALADSGGDATPLVAFNTASGLGWPDTVHFGLLDPGSYYMRVNHKRKFEEPCLEERPQQECLNPNGICFEFLCEITSSSNAADIGLGCTCPEGTMSCNIDESTGSICECRDQTVPNCGLGIPRFKDTCWQQTEECVLYGGVETPESEITSQYNFSWFGTRLAPFTVDSPAYDLFQQRPSWFNQ